jgi:hypothetical protein
LLVDRYKAPRSVAGRWDIALHVECMDGRPGSSQISQTQHGGPAASSSRLHSALSTLNLTSVFPASLGRSFVVHLNAIGNTKSSLLDQSKATPLPSLLLWGLAQMGHTNSMEVTLQKHGSFIDPASSPPCPQPNLLTAYPSCASAGMVAPSSPPV